MKLKPEELSAKGYTLLDKMDHAELIPFVKLYLNKKTVSSSVYYGSIMVSLGVLLFFFTKFYRLDMLTATDGILHFSVGVSIALSLIPLHELIHALAYKLLGAEQTSYDVNLKKFYFLAVANRFLANRQEFQLVALAPFVLITLGSAMIAIFTGPSWTIAVLTVILIHASFCSGDFALLSYFEFNKHKEIVTFDDKENNVSYIFGREK